MRERDVRLRPALGYENGVSANGANELLVGRSDELQPLVEHLSQRSVMPPLEVKTRIKAHCVKSIDEDGVRIPNATSFGTHLTAGPHQSWRLGPSLDGVWVAGADGVQGSVEVIVHRVFWLEALAESHGNASRLTVDATTNLWRQTQEEGVSIAGTAILVPCGDTLWTGLDRRSWSADESLVGCKHEGLCLFFATLGCHFGGFYRDG